MSDDISALIKKARRRAASMGAEYAGDLFPAEAHRLVREAGARIVDVRTHAEWNWVGHVPGSVLIEWEMFPGNRPNAGFVDELSAHFQRQALLVFLCRSGKRSMAAASAGAKAGFGNVYNVVEGFEGDLDRNRHRNTLGGWKKAGLPWIQT